MMSRRKLHQLVPFLTAYLLVASLGLPLQRIYCACRGEAWLSISADSHECQMDKSPKAVVQVEKKISCCSAAKACHAPTEGVQDLHDCGDTDIILAQLDADFLLQDVGDFLELSGTAIILDRPVAPWVRPLTPRSLPIRGPDPPPLLSGRALLVVHQTFLI